MIPLILAATILADSTRRDTPVMEMPPVVVTATRHPMAWDLIPATTYWVRTGVGQRGFPRGLTDAVGIMPGVLPQKTSAGQGSPFVRGFTGFRNVYLIDGIRLNHSAFREGPNQYWSTIDAMAVDRVEVAAGASSVLYGSDAIGGVLQALSRVRVDGEAPGPRAGLRYRGASAERSHAGRLWVDWPWTDALQVAGGVTTRRFGNLEGGRSLGSQPYTGYDEEAGDLRLAWHTRRGTLSACYQQLAQTDVPRTHATVFARSFAGTTVGTDLERELDQDRRLMHLRFISKRETPSRTHWLAAMSWHRQGEEEERVRASGSRQVQGFDVGTFGAQLQATRGGTIAGAEYYRDRVDSYSTTSAIQGPVADDARYETGAAYVQSEITRGSWLAQLGARHTVTGVHAGRFEDPITHQARSLRDGWRSTVGSVRFGYRPPTARWMAFTGASQGFRAPNLSDLTRFDAARTREIEIPAPGLDPERYVTIEAGARWNDSKLRLSASLFRTFVRDQIVRRPTGRTLGTDVEVTKANAGDGWVHGVEASAVAGLGDSWSVSVEGAWQRGELDQYPTSSTTPAREPVSRLAPTGARSRLAWHPAGSPFGLEAEAVVAGRQSRLSSEDLRDTSRIPPGGTPGYQVIHLRSSLRMSSHAQIVLSLENVADSDHRVHGSGTNEPGRNVVLGLDAMF